MSTTMEEVVTQLQQELFTLTAQAASQSAGEHIFNQTAMQARKSASNCLAKAIRASHGQRESLQSQAKERGRSKGSDGAKGSGKGKTSNTGISGLENMRSDTSSETQESVQMGQVETTDRSWIHDDWKPDEWNDG